MKATIDAAVAELAAAVDETPRAYFPRVTQLDAGLLDDELLHILRAQSGAMLNRVVPNLLQRLMPEVEAALRLAIFAFTVAAERPTPGQRLLGLRFQDARSARRAAPSRAQKGGFAAAIIAQCAFARLRRHMLSNGWDDRAPAGVALSGAVPRASSPAPSTTASSAAAATAAVATHVAAKTPWRVRVWVAVRRVRVAWGIASFINFIALLTGRGGGYGTLVQRMLRVRAARDLRKDAIEPSFQMLNQQLLWSSVGALMLEVSPFVPWGALSAAGRGGARAVRAAWRGARRLVGYDAPRMGESASAEGARSAAAASALGCAACHSAAPCMPYRAQCGHVYCYVCMAQLCARGATCAECKEPLITSTRLGLSRTGAATA